MTASTTAAVPQLLHLARIESQWLATQREKPLNQKKQLCVFLDGKTDKDSELAFPVLASINFFQSVLRLLPVILSDTFAMSFSSRCSVFWNILKVDRHGLLKPFIEQLANQWRHNDGSIDCLHSTQSSSSSSSSSHRSLGLNLEFESLREGGFRSRIWDVANAVAEILDKTYEETYTASVFLANDGTEMEDFDASCLGIAFFFFRWMRTPSTERQTTVFDIPRVSYVSLSKIFDRAVSHVLNLSSESATTKHTFSSAVQIVAVQSQQSSHCKQESSASTYPNEFLVNCHDQKQLRQIFEFIVVPLVASFNPQLIVFHYDFSYNLQPEELANITQSLAGLVHQKIIFVSSNRVNDKMISANDEITTSNKKSSSSSTTTKRISSNRTESVDYLDTPSPHKSKQSQQQQFPQQMSAPSKLKSKIAEKSLNRTNLNNGNNDESSLLSFIQLSPTGTAISQLIEESFRQKAAASNSAESLLASSTKSSLKSLIGYTLFQRNAQLFLSNQTVSQNWLQRQPNYLTLLDFLVSLVPECEYHMHLTDNIILSFYVSQEEKTKQVLSKHSLQQSESSLLSKPQADIIDILLAAAHGMIELQAEPSCHFSSPSSTVCDAIRLILEKRNLPKKQKDILQQQQQVQQLQIESLDLPTVLPDSTVRCTSETTAQDAIILAAAEEASRLRLIKAKHSIKFKQMKHLPAFQSEEQTKHSSFTAAAVTAAAAAAAAAATSSSTAVKGKTINNRKAPASLSEQQSFPTQTQISNSNITSQRKSSAVVIDENLKQSIAAKQSRLQNRMKNSIFDVQRNCFVKLFYSCESTAGGDSVRLFHFPESTQSLVLYDKGLLEVYFFDVVHYGKRQHVVLREQQLPAGNSDQILFTAVFLSPLTSEVSRACISYNSRYVFKAFGVIASNPSKDNGRPEGQKKIEVIDRHCLVTSLCMMDPTINGSGVSRFQFTHSSSCASFIEGEKCFITFFGGCNAGDRSLSATSIVEIPLINKGQQIGSFFKVVFFAEKAEYMAEHLTALAEQQQRQAALTNNTPTERKYASLSDRERLLLCSQKEGRRVYGMIPRFSPSSTSVYVPNEDALYVLAAATLTSEQQASDRRGIEATRRFSVMRFGQVRQTKSLMNIAVASFERDTTNNFKNNIFLTTPGVPLNIPAGTITSVGGTNGCDQDIILDRITSRFAQLNNFSSSTDTGTKIVISSALTTRTQIDVTFGSEGEFIYSRPPLITIQSL